VEEEEGWKEERKEGEAREMEMWQLLTMQAHVI
jgi:hypothetical protein